MVPGSGEEAFQVPLHAGISDGVARVSDFFELSYASERLYKIGVFVSPCNFWWPIQLLRESHRNKPWI